MHLRLQLSYKWRSLFLVVNGRAGQLDWRWTDSMAGETMLGVVCGLKRYTQVAAIVWDGAPGHRDKSVRGLGLPLIQLPASSPQLNPAERVFKEIRRQIGGKVC